MEVVNATNAESQFRELPLANYNEIVLTEEEEKEALRLARKAKYHQQKNAEWRERIAKEPKQIEVSAADFKKVISGIYPEFKPELQQSQFDFIFDYFMREDSKGLLLYGGVGCGKTTMMEVFRANPKRSFGLKSCREISALFSSGGHEQIAPYYRLLEGIPNVFKHTEFGLCLDDMGEEPTTKHYGNQMNVIEDIILSRYSNKNLWNRTYVTTNLTGDQIEELYGLRVRSRMREMFNLIKFENIGDLRKNA